MTIKIQKNNRVTFINNKNPSENWKSWKKYRHCNQSEKTRINLREIRSDEIVLDYEDGLTFKNGSKGLGKEGLIAHLIYKTGSRGVHVHLFFNNLSQLPFELRNKIRRLFIEKFNADITKASEKTLISIEGRPHFKTGENGQIVDDKLKIRKNTLSEELITTAKNELKIIFDNASTIQVDNDFTTYPTSDPLFNFFKEGKIPKNCEKNNVIFKNIAVALVKGGFADQQIKSLISPVISKYYNDKNYLEFSGWVKKARSGEITEYNYNEITNWCKRHEFEDLYKKECLADVGLERKFNFFMNDKLRVAEDFIKEYPIYYDKSRIWWIWNSAKSKWEKSEETDILNAINSAAFANTIRTREKYEILESLKQVGRKNKPKDPNSFWVQFGNVVVDIKTGEKFPASPRYFMTNVVPWEIGESEDTPVIDKLLEEWVSSREQNISYKDTLYEILSYFPLSSYPLHRVFCLIGSGLNGKSCFEKLVDTFVGEENTTSADLTLLKSSRFESSKLFKKNVCYINEIDVGYFKSTSNFKAATGGDKLRGEFKGKDGFEFYNYAKILISTNALPESGDNTPGFYRRWLIIDFPNTFSEKEDVLSKIPEYEYKNLARKSIRILKKVLLQGGFTNEGTIEQRKQRYEKHSNPLGKFIEEYYERDLNAFIKNGEFCEKFKEFLKSRKLRVQSTIEIGKTLEKIGFTRKNKHVTNGYGGNDTCYIIEGLKIKKGENS